MDPKTYLAGVLKTESVDMPAIRSRLDSDSMRRLLHAGLGLATESGEFLDAIKKHVFYGRMLDEVNLQEELGDLLWYCGVACSVLGTTFEDVMQRNHDKLFARYPGKFTETAANTRDLDRERAILEGSKQDHEVSAMPLVAAMTNPWSCDAPGCRWNTKRVNDDFCLRCRKMYEYMEKAIDDEPR